MVLVLLKVLVAFLRRRPYLRNVTCPSSLCLLLTQGYFEFNVDVAFYEIFDEMITDLLKPDNLASTRNHATSVGPFCFTSIFLTYKNNDKAKDRSRVQRLRDECGLKLERVRERALSTSLLTTSSRSNSCIEQRISVFGCPSLLL